MNDPNASEPMHSTPSYLMRRLSALIDDEDAGNDDVRDAAIDVVGCPELFASDELVALVRRAYRSLNDRDELTRPEHELWTDLGTIMMRLDPQA